MSKLIIPEFEKFYDIFVSRINAVIQHLENYENCVFIFFYVIDRRVGASEENIIINVGLDTQLKFLTDRGINVDFKDELIIKSISVIKDNETKLDNNRLAVEFSSGSLSLNDITVARLDDYLNNGLRTIQQEAESILLSSIFEIKNSFFVSIPLIQFGDIEGVVHLVFDSNDRPKFNKSSIGRIIKNFSLEFENLLLDWDVMLNSNNIEPNSYFKFQIEYLISEEYSDPSVRINPIFKDLKYREYYLDNMPFFLERVRQSDVIPQLFVEQRKKIEEYEKLLTENESVFWEIPVDLQTAFQQFLCFFSEYVKIISGKSLELNITKNEKGLKLSLLNEFSVSLDEVNFHLLNYFNILSNQSIEKFGTKLNESALGISEIFELKQFVRELQHEKNNLLFKIDSYLDKINFTNSVLNDKERQIKNLELTIRYFQTQNIERLKIAKQNSVITINKKSLLARGRHQTDDIRKLISENKLENALMELGVMVEHDHKISNNVTILLAKYNHLLEDMRIGIIQDDLFLTQKLRIQKSVLELCDEISINEG